VKKDRTLETMLQPGNGFAVSMVTESQAKRIRKVGGDSGHRGPPSQHHTRKPPFMQQHNNNHKPSYMQAIQLAAGLRVQGLGPGVQSCLQGRRPCGLIDGGRHCTTQHHGMVWQVL